MKPLHYAEVTPLLSEDSPFDLQKQVHSALLPFVRYLTQAIEGARRRQARQRVLFEEVPRPLRLRVTPLDTWLELRLPEGGLQVSNWPAGRPYDRARKLNVTDSEDRVRSLTVREVIDDPAGPILLLDEPLGSYETLSWNGVPCALTPVAGVAVPEVLRDQRGARFPVRKRRALSDQRVQFLVAGHPEGEVLQVGAQDLPFQRLPVTQGLTRLTHAGGSLPAPTADREGLWLEIPKERAPSGPGELQGDNEVRFQVTPERRSGKEDGVLIQLLLPPGATDSDATVDPRAALCDEDPEQVLTREGPLRGKDDRDAYRVLRVRAESYQLVLDRLPPKGSTLYPVINISNLDRQRRAVYRLKDAPLPHHAGLLRLCRPPSAPWPALTQRAVDDWQILKDATVDGTLQQRAFVEQALGTPDLAVLEGPPGSGKTTVICELVLQLVRAGQRVLLCSSTHNAVDNVLERLHLRPEVDAVRIGHSDKVDDNLQGCLLAARVEALSDKLIADPALCALPVAARAELAERVVLGAANLTCGTTMGVLAHPYLRGDRDEARARQAAAPHFDVLIVDEASKTQIQEFLVPALLCRRWIIIGDIRQLPPFAERADLEGNLHELQDERRQHLLSAAQQRALLLSFRLQQFRAYREEARWLLVEGDDTLAWLARELAAQPALPGPVVWIGEQAPPPGDAVRVVSPAALRRGDDAALWLLCAWAVLVSPERLDEVQALLPPDLLHLSRPGAAPLRARSALAHRHQRWLQQRAAPSFQQRAHGQSQSPATAEQEEAEWLASNGWPEQIAWRLVRRHELRRSSAAAKREGLAEEVRALLPRSGRATDVREAIEAIEDIALPSILEVLQEGVGAVRGARSSVLTQGVPERARAARWAMLSYQHRMHPEISALPRALFYEGQALLDAGPLRDREARVGWSFAPGAPRRAVLAVEGGDAHGLNQREVDEMERVLVAFLAWAREHPNRQRPWEVACLTFYLRQEQAISDMLRRLLRQPNRRTRFSAPGVDISCCVVDRFQGREADLVLLSLRNARRVGFLNSPNRMNVALTRARFQLVVLGNQRFFQRCRVTELEQLFSQTRPWPPLRPGAKVQP